MSKRRDEEPDVEETAPELERYHDDDLRKRSPSSPSAPASEDEDEPAD